MKTFKNPLKIFLHVIHKWRYSILKPTPYPIFQHFSKKAHILLSQTHFIYGRDVIYGRPLKTSFNESGVFRLSSSSSSKTWSRSFRIPTATSALVVRAVVSLIPLVVVVDVVVVVGVLRSVMLALKTFLKEEQTRQISCIKDSNWKLD